MPSPVSTSTASSALATLQGLLRRGSTGCVSARDAVGGLRQVYVSQGEVLAAAAPDDGECVLRRLVNEGLIGPRQASALAARLEPSGSTEDLLAGHVAEARIQSALEARFRQNLFEFIGMAGPVEFTPTDGVFVANVRDVPDSQGLLRSLIERAERLAPIVQRRGPLTLRPSALRPTRPEHQRVVELCDPEVAWIELLASSPFEPADTAELVVDMLSRGVLVSDEPLRVGSPRPPAVEDIYQFEELFSLDEGLGHRPAPALSDDQLRALAEPADDGEGLEFGEALSDALARWVQQVAARPTPPSALPTAAASGSPAAVAENPSVAFAHDRIDTPPALTEEWADAAPERAAARLPAGVSAPGASRAWGGEAPPAPAYPPDGADAQADGAAALRLSAPVAGIGAGDSTGLPSDAQRFPDPDDVFIDDSAALPLDALVLADADGGADGDTGALADAGRAASASDRGPAGDTAVAVAPAAHTVPDGDGVFAEVSASASSGAVGFADADGAFAGDTAVAVAPVAHTVPDGDGVFAEVGASAASGAFGLADADGAFAGDTAVAVVPAAHTASDGDGVFAEVSAAAALGAFGFADADGAFAGDTAVAVAPAAHTSARAADGVAGNSAGAQATTLRDVEMDGALAGDAGEAAGPSRDGAAAPRPDASLLSLAARHLEEAAARRAARTARTPSAADAHALEAWLRTEAFVVPGAAAGSAGRRSASEADVDPGLLELFADHDDRRGLGDGQFDVAASELDRVDLRLDRVDPAGPGDDDVLEADEADAEAEANAINLNFGPPPLREDEARAKIGVAREVLAALSARLDAHVGAGAGAAAVQVLLEGAPGGARRLWMGAQAASDEQLDVLPIMANLRRLPQAERRSALDGALSDLIERALATGCETMPSDMADDLIAAVAGYQQRLGL